jgi:hypothetical protein
MNRYVLSLSLLGTFVSFACGGNTAELDLDEADFAEDVDYVAGEGDDDPERYEPAAAVGNDPYDREFESLASSALFQNFVSRVDLVLAVDCPTAIHDGDVVPWRCLNVRTQRHPLISDVDVMSPDTPIRFHRLRSFLSAGERDITSYGCGADRQPNGQVDLHSSGVRKFVGAGYYRAANGQRRYEVLFRRKADGSYRLLPARPKLDSLEWREFKPHSGVCIALNR